jgi:Holliday junction DNA helicase RuvA
VTENSNSLFAFHNETEKHLFQMLISVSGIGPKTAINLLSAVTPEEFKRRLIAGEVAMLTALPGIGPKTARRIIVELKDKFVNISKDDLPKEGDMAGASGDAYDALLALGFQAKDIRGSILKVTSNQQDLSTEEIIKQTLAELR